jgi:hypothetical protein
MISNFQLRHRMRVSACKDTTATAKNRLTGQDNLIFVAFD